MSKNEIDMTIGYSEAVKELEAILAQLEKSDVDVDKLTVQVQRAAVLIEVCREKIGAAKLEVEEVVKTIESDL